MKSIDQQLLEEAYSKINGQKLTNESSHDTEDLDLLETWMEKNAVRYDDEYDLTKLVEALGYRQGLREFFADNPGAIEVVFNWVSETIDSAPEWKENLKDSLRGYEEDSSNEYEDDNSSRSVE